MNAPRENSDRFYVLVRSGEGILCNFSRMKWSRPESEKKDAGWEEKGKRRDAECELWCTHFSILLFLARLLSPLFLFFTVSQHHAVLVQASSVPVRLSSSLISNLGVVADGGGGRVRMVVVMVGRVVGSFVPILLPISPFSPYGRARRAPVAAHCAPSSS